MPLARQSLLPRELAVVQSSATTSVSRELLAVLSLAAPGKQRLSLCFTSSFSAVFSHSRSSAMSLFFFVFFPLTIVRRRCASLTTPKMRRRLYSAQELSSNYQPLYKSGSRKQPMKMVYYCTSRCERVVSPKQMYCAVRGGQTNLSPRSLPGSDNRML